MANVIFPTPLRQRDLWPNWSNLATPNANSDVKKGVIAGPLYTAGLPGAPSRWLGYIESIKNTDVTAANDDQTLGARFDSPTLQSLIESYDRDDTPVWAAITGGHNETAPTTLLRRTDAPGYWVIVHYGNNTGPRQIAVLRCDDFAGITWSVEQAPAIALGAGGSPDATGIADGGAVTLRNGSTVVFYRATNGSTISMCKATKAAGANWSALTKSAGNPVVAAAAIVGGVVPGTPILDPQDRLHMYLGGADPSKGVWYIYSDDSGETWSAPNNVLPVSGTVGQADAYSLGDTVSAVADRDVIYLIAGGENLVDFPGGIFRGRMSFVTPYVKSAGFIARQGKFYYPGVRAYTLMTPTGGLGFLNQSAFIAAFRFRAFRFQRVAEPARHIYTEESVFNNSFYFRLETGALNGGKLAAFYRTPTAIVNMIGPDTRYDDGEFHVAAFVRRQTGGNQFELWVDGRPVLTDTTDPATNAGSPMYPSIGNWHVTTAEPNEPFRGTLEGVGVYGEPPASAATWAAIVAMMGPTPVVYSGGTLAWDSKTSGTDTGDVYLVDTAQPGFGWIENQSPAFR